MAARITVVEDDPTMQALLATILEERGHEVTVFGTVRAAAEALREAAPDLLIVDVRLPDGCGLDLVGTVRTEAGRKVPAIVLSGLGEEGDIVRGFAAGAIDYLLKPIKSAELLARCAVHLARSCAFETPAHHDLDLPEKDGLVFGRYRVKKELGRGGYGRVYLARDAQRSDALVALKVLAPLSGEQTEARLRFIRETYTLSSVRHPSVAQIHDVGTVQGRLYFAMDYVEGESLAAYVRKRGPLDENEVRSLAKGLLGALTAIDAAGLVHRDLKPENVILRKGKVADPVLIDFGLAKRGCDRGITEANVLIGTVAYLSPEVIRGRDPDRRSDLFALGLTLRHALTAEEIFPDLQGVELMTAIATKPIPPALADLSDEFAVFLGSLYANSPDSRVPTPSQALEWLRLLPAVPPSPEGPRIALESAPSPAKSVAPRPPRDDPTDVLPRARVAPRAPRNSQTDVADALAF